MDIQLENTETRIAPTKISLLAMGLQKAAEHSQVLKDIGTVFATRERSRQQVTVHSLYAKMLKEGFTYNRKQPAGALKILALHRQPVKFVKLPAIDFVAETPKAVTPPAQKPDKATSRKYTAILAVTVDQETIEFNLPRKLTMQEVSELLTRIYATKGAE